MSQISILVQSISEGPV